MTIIKLFLILLATNYLDTKLVSALKNDAIGLENLLTEAYVGLEQERYEQKYPRKLSPEEKFKQIKDFAGPNDSRFLKDPLDLHGLTMKNILVMLMLKEDPKTYFTYPLPTRAEYGTVDFSNIQRIPFFFFNRFLQTFGKNIIFLNMSETDISDKHLEFINDSCKSLEFLDLTGCKKITPQKIDFL